MHVLDYSNYIQCNFYKFGSETAVKFLIITLNCLFVMSFFSCLLLFYAVLLFSVCVCVCVGYIVNIQNKSPINIYNITRTLLSL